MTIAEREDTARQYECPRLRCGAKAGKPCRTGVPSYTPMGFDHPRYGRPMKHVHPERLALVPEEAMALTQTDYPNREHENEVQAAQRRALARLDEIETEVKRLRRRLKDPEAQVDGSEGYHIAGKASELILNLTILETLRDVREWHAADQHEQGETV